MTGDKATDDGTFDGKRLAAKIGRRKQAAGRPVAVRQFVPRRWSLVRAAAGAVTAFGAASVCASCGNRTACSEHAGDECGDRTACSEYAGDEKMTGGAMTARPRRSWTLNRGRTDRPGRLARGSRTVAV